jgi:hypothetical protein
VGRDLATHSHLYDSIYGKAKAFTPLLDKPLEGPLYLRSSSNSLPDLVLALQMQGGKKGLLVNSRNICKHTNRATARFGAHNGKTFEGRPVLKDSCKGKKR